MLTYPDINPVALQIGSLAIHWYGIMYVLGFVGVFWSCYVRRTESQSGSAPWDRDEIVDLLFYAFQSVNCLSRCSSYNTCSYSNVNKKIINYENK